MSLFYRCQMIADLIRMGVITPQEGKTMIEMPDPNNPERTYPTRIQQAIVRALCKSSVRAEPRPEQYAETYLSRHFVNVTSLKTWIVTKYQRDGTAWLQIRVGEPHGEQVVQIEIDNCREGYLEMLESMEC